VRTDACRVRVTVVAVTFVDGAPLPDPRVGDISG
jgi:hypothetical protein